MTGTPQLKSCISMSMIAGIAMLYDFFMAGS
jgi:hypothetical protein